MSEAFEALRSTYKRQRVHNDQVVFKLPSAVKELVKEVAVDQGISDSAVIRDALAEYFERRGYSA